MFFRGAATARGAAAGRVFLAGAQVHGTVEFAGIDFMLAPKDFTDGRDVGKRKTLTLANASIGGDLAWLDKPSFGGACTAVGHMNIDSSHVGGRLRIALQTAEEAFLDLKACEIDAALQIRAQPLSAANSGTLVIDASDAAADAIQIWGYEAKEEIGAWSLRVPGMTYSGLAGSKSLDRGAQAQLDEAFLRWFRCNVVDESARHRHNFAFSPQPYQHFISLCRTEGFDDVADGAMIAWIRESHGRGVRRILFGAFGLVSKYGLDPGRASLAWLLGWLLCGCAVLALQFNLPNAFVDPEPQSIRGQTRLTLESQAGEPAGYDRVGTIERHQVTSFECAGRINPATYALDVMLPIANFHQEDLCPQRGRDEADHRVLAVSTGFAILRILGAILTAILLLAFSGISRRIWR